MSRSSRRLEAEEKSLLIFLRRFYLLYRRFSGKNREAVVVRIRNYSVEWLIEAVARLIAVIIGRYSAESSGGTTLKRSAGRIIVTTTHKLAIMTR